MQLCSSLSILWHCLSFGLEWKHLFQSCSHCWVFQICWHIECSTFIASSFRIWNSSTGISSPPLALFVVVLSKAHFTSHSRMSGSRWVIIPSWLSGLWRSFLYSSSVYSVRPHLIRIYVIDKGIIQLRKLCHLWLTLKWVMGICNMYLALLKRRKRSVVGFFFFPYL